MAGRSLPLKLSLNARIAFPAPSFKNFRFPHVHESKALAAFARASRAFSFSKVAPVLVNEVKSDKPECKK